MSFDLDTAERAVAPGRSGAQSGAISIAVGEENVPAATTPTEASEPGEPQ
jgi:hypothetical protein